MVKTTARNFTIKEFSGDKAYLSRENLEVVVKAGGMPYFPFKTNSVARNSHHRQDARASLWERMYHLFHSDPEWFDHYHRRSNVESCMWMIKSKFGAFVRGKTPTAIV